MFCDVLRCNIISFVAVTQAMSVIASEWVSQRVISTLLYPVSLLIGYWDWVQGGNPLYAAVKCLSGCRGHIWQKNNFFAKRTWHTQFLAGKFFSGSKKFFIPPKLAVFCGFRHFPKIEGPFPKFSSFDNLFFAQEIVWKPSVILLLCLFYLWKLLVPLSWPFFSIYNSNDKLEQRHLVFVFNKNHNANPHLQWKKLFPELRDRPSILGKGPSPKKQSILGAKTPRKCTKFFSRLPNIYKIYILQKNGPNRPILSSAVIQIIYCRL